MTAPVAHAADGTGADVLFDEGFLRRLEQLELASRRLTAGRMKGERRSVRRGQSVEFADYRNYAAGDDDLVDRYRTRLGEWQEEIATFCARRGGAYVSVRSDLDLADLLFDVLRRRRVIE